MEEEKIKELITTLRTSLRTAQAALDALEAEGEAVRSRMWCVKIYWGWVLLDDEDLESIKQNPTPDDSSFPVWCEKLDNFEPGSIAKLKPGVGSVLSALAKYETYRIVALDTGEAEAQVVRMWCVKTVWGWALWSSAPAASAKLYPVWCEKTEIEGADHLINHAPGAGDVLCACGTETAYRIVAIYTGGVDLEAEAQPQNKPNKLESFWCSDGGEYWFLTKGKPKQKFYSIKVFCEKVEDSNASDALASRPAVGKVLKYCITDDHAWRIVEAPEEKEAKEETLHYMWACRKLLGEWRISITQVFGFADQTQIICKKVDDCDAYVSDEGFPKIGSKWKESPYKAHAWEIVGTGRSSAPALEAFWCGRRDGRWELSHHSDRFTDAYQVWCEKVDNTEAKDYSDTRPVVGDMLKFCYMDAHAYRITELPGVAKEEPLYYMWAWHKRAAQWRISRTQRYEKVAYQTLVQCKKIDYIDNLPGVEDLDIGSKFTLPDVKTHAWEVVGTGRTKQPALQAFWCGRRDDLDDNWFIRNFDNRFTDAFQVWCEKVGNAEGGDYSDTRPVVGDILKFDRTDLNAYRIVEIIK